MIRHVVMWRLKEEALGQTRSQLAGELKKRLEGLVGKVPCILTLEVGLNTVPSDTATDVCLVSTFEDRAGLQAYVDHPEHKKVADFLKEVVAERRANDYEVMA
ncbi:MAG TPA: Dabb family protein [bacterium]|jgi:hypothetical protein|nr:Dabb family protein [bacterium]